MSKNITLTAVVFTLSLSACLTAAESEPEEVVDLSRDAVTAEGDEIEYDHPECKLEINNRVEECKQLEDCPMPEAECGYVKIYQCWTNKSAGCAGGFCDDGSGNRCFNAGVCHCLDSEGNPCDAL